MTGIHRRAVKFLDAVDSLQHILTHYTRSYFIWSLEWNNLPLLRTPFRPNLKKIRWALFFERQEYSLKVPKVLCWSCWQRKILWPDKKNLINTDFIKSPKQCQTLLMQNGCLDYQWKIDICIEQLDGRKEKLKLLYSNTGNSLIIFSGDNSTTFQKKRRKTIKRKKNKKHTEGV